MLLVKQLIAMCIRHVIDDFSTNNPHAHKDLFQTSTSFHMHYTSRDISLTGSGIQLTAVTAALAPS